MSAVVRDDNGTALVTVAVQGYVTAYPSNAAATTATTDYPFKWGATGLQTVNHVMIYNGTSANVGWELDAVTSAGSPQLAAGQYLFLDVQTSVLHLYTANIQNVNGTSSGNIVIRAWM